MPNPYAAKSGRVRRVRQSSPLDEFIRRLRLLGATDDEIAVTRDNWDVFDDDWTAADRARLVRLPDEELRAEIVATRREYRHDTTDETQQEHIDATAHVAEIRAQAAETVGRPVAQVLTWVGDDPIRAIAILDLETGDAGAKRKTLVPLLEAIVSPPEAEGIPVEVLS